MRKTCFSCDKMEPKEPEGSYFTRYRKFWFNKVLWLCGECSEWGINHKLIFEEIFK